MATIEQTSTRYNQLLKVIDKALLESRKGFDTEEAIKECYGDDASMFHDGSSHEADSNSVNVLASAIDAMVDRVNEKVKKEMLEFLERERVPERLAKVEAIINQLDAADQEQKQAESNDRQSARDALDAVRLPKDILPADIMRYHAYKLMEQERDALIEELAKVEGESSDLDERIRKCEAVVKQGARTLQDIGQELQKSTAMLSESKSEE